MTCDVGMQDRKRTCLNHVVDEYLPVSNCSGDSREFRSCTVVKCTRKSNWFLAVFDLSFITKIYLKIHFKDARSVS